MISKLFFYKDEHLELWLSVYKSFYKKNKNTEYYKHGKHCLTKKSYDFERLIIECIGCSQFDNLIKSDILLIFLTELNWFS